MDESQSIAYVENHPKYSALIHKLRNDLKLGSYVTDLSIIRCIYGNLVEENDRKVNFLESRLKLHNVYIQKQVSFEPNPESKRIGNYCIYNLDKCHNPVLYAKMDLDVEFINNNVDLLEENILKTSFHFREISNALTEKYDRPIWRLVVVVDFEGANLLKLITLSSKVKEILEILKALNESALKKVIILNAPFFVSVVMKVLRLVASEGTIKKVELGSFETLQKYIDIENIPKKYGGRCKMEFEKATITLPTDLYDSRELY